MPSEIRSDLDFLVGKWKLTADFRGETVSGTWTARWSDAKNTLIIEAESKMGNVPHRTTGILGYDSATGRIREFGFDNDGSRITEYTRIGDTTWAGVSVGNLMGKPFDFSAKLVRIDADNWKYEMNPAGEPTATIKYTRR